MEAGNSFWFLLVGGLLLAMGLTAPLIKRIPATSAMIYLSVGIIIGPTGLGLFHINPLQQSALLEILTEVVVLVSLFAAGVKMPVPFRWRRWHAPIQLAFLSMACTVGLVAWFAVAWLDLPVGAAILLGAIVAPTDPVLATDVQVTHPGDRDRLRFSLTSEAGLNDGSAFPFVMLGLGLLGLHDIGSGGGAWLLRDVAWATIAGLVLGVVSGNLLARLAGYLRGRQPVGHGFLDDFLGLGLIGVVYGGSLLIGAWGFLAVFTAAVSLRQAEQARAGASPETAKLQEGRAQSVTVASGSHSVSEGSLVFKEHLERLSEVLLILLIGGTLFVDSWSWRAVGFALFLFLVARPISVMIGLLGTRVPVRVRGLIAWFGVRGVGSLYYLMYAIEHGLPGDLALELTQIVLVVVSLSILVHGLTVKPMVNRYACHKLSVPT
ncbi:cation:proton antiporter, partial [Porticoccus sp.]